MPRFERAREPLSFLVSVDDPQAVGALQGFLLRLGYAAVQVGTDELEVFPRGPRRLAAARDQLENDLNRFRGDRQGTELRLAAG